MLHWFFIWPKFSIFLLLIFNFVFKNVDIFVLNPWIHLNSSYLKPYHHFFCLQLCSALYPYLQVIYQINFEILSWQITSWKLNIANPRSLAKLFVYFVLSCGWNWIFCSDAGSCCLRKENGNPTENNCILLNLQLFWEAERCDARIP